jgi:hypothetical protein
MAEEDSMVDFISLSFSPSLLSSIGDSSLECIASKKIIIYIDGRLVLI